MAADPFYETRHPHEIQGHPTLTLVNDLGEQTLITVCAECGEMRTVLFLSKDRWFCFRCKTSGASPPNLYPIA